MMTPKARRVVVDLEEKPENQLLSTLVLLVSVLHRMSDVR